MTQIFDSEGKQVPVTVVTAGPCRVTQVKRRETDGYEAVQIGFLEQKPQRVAKPLRGHFKAAGVTPMRHLAEFRAVEPDAFKEGDTLSAEAFAPGDFVNIVGISKGRGFSGAMKRWGFHGGPASHGGMFDRRVGAIGMHSDPSRVFKGKKMAGRFGNDRVTVKNLEIVDVDPERNLILIKGSVPGARKGVLKITTDGARAARAAKE